MASRLDPGTAEKGAACRALNETEKSLARLWYLIVMEIHQSISDLQGNQTPEPRLAILAGMHCPHELGSWSAS